MKQKLITISVLLGLSLSAFAQKASDIKRLDNQKQNLITKIQKVEAYLEEDRTTLFACHPDLLAPFETLKASALEQTVQTQDAIDTNISKIVDGEGLTAIVASLDVRRSELKNEKNKLRKKELKKLLEEKVSVSREVVKGIQTEVSPAIKSSIQKLLVLNGLIDVRSEESSIRLKELLNSCESKDCVYLISAEIKNIVKKTLAVNKKIQIVKGITIGKSKTSSSKKSSKRLDKIVATVSAGKPLANLDPSCVPTKATKVPKKSKDDSSDDDSGSVPGHGGSEVVGGAPEVI
jgi:hypothetical protein